MPFGWKAWAAVAAAALAALPGAPALAQSSAVVGERAGWLVEAYTIPLGESGEIRYCVASRPNDPPPRLGFMATRATAGLLVDVAAPELERGVIYAVDVAVDEAAATRRPARPVTTTVLGLMENGTDVAALLDPYARGRSVAVRIPAHGDLSARISLAGSGWAIRTLAGCRNALSE